MSSFLCYSFLLLSICCFLSPFSATASADDGGSYFGSPCHTVFPIFDSDNCTSGFWCNTGQYSPPIGTSGVCYPIHQPAGSPCYQQSACSGWCWDKNQPTYQCQDSIPPGGQCKGLMVPYECVDNYFCNTLPNATGPTALTCIPQLQSGPHAICNNNIDCFSGTCSGLDPRNGQPTGLCRYPGQACKILFFGDTCPSGFFCNAHMPRPPVNQAGQCYPIHQPAGSECYSQNACSGFCDNNPNLDPTYQCQDSIAPFKKCKGLAVSYECVDGYFCDNLASDNTTSQYLTCIPLLSNGQICTSGYQCNSGYCTATPNNPVGACSGSGGSGGGNNNGNAGSAILLILLLIFLVPVGIAVLVSAAVFTYRCVHKSGQAGAVMAPARQQLIYAQPVNAAAYPQAHQQYPVAYPQQPMRGYQHGQQVVYAMPAQYQQQQQPYQPPPQYRQPANGQYQPLQ